MAFTYDLSTDIGKVRFEISDTVEAVGASAGVGAKPDGTNFSDEEISSLLETEGESWGRAAAHACEILATAWAAVPDTTVGPRTELSSQVSFMYGERAKALRARFGGDALVISAQPTRVDGYSVHAAGEDEFA